MMAPDNCDKAMLKLLAAGLISEYSREGVSFQYTLTDKGRELQSSLRSEKDTDGLTPGDLAQIAYGLNFDKDEAAMVKVIVQRRVEINGRTWNTPAVDVSPWLWRGLCLHCVAPFAGTYYVDKEQVFFCTNCGARGHFKNRGTLTRVDNPKEEGDEHRDSEGQGKAAQGGGAQGGDERDGSRQGAGEVGDTRGGECDDGDDGRIGPYGADDPGSIRGPGEPGFGDDHFGGFGEPGRN